MKSELIKEKERLVSLLMHQLRERERNLRETLKALTASAESESKSTAGDKHETGRAMIHLEQEKLSAQLSGLAAEIEQLARMDQSPSTIVKVGSLVITNMGRFLIAPIAGKVEGVYVVSPGSPLGRALLGKGLNDRIQMNGRAYTVLELS